MNKESEARQPISIFQSKKFQEKPALEKQVAQEGIDWGFIVQNQFINLEQWSKYYYLWTVSVHEMGHAFLVNETGHNLNRITNIADGHTEGATFFNLNTSLPEERVDSDLVDIGLAGGVAAEVVGLPPVGIGSDHNMVDFVAERQRRRSRPGLKSRGRQRVWGSLSGRVTDLRYGGHRLNRERVMNKAS